MATIPSERDDSYYLINTGDERDDFYSLINTGDERDDSYSLINTGDERDDFYSLINTGDERDDSYYLINTGDEPEQILEPINGYASKPIVSLEEACKPLRSIISRLDDFVRIAKRKSKNPADNLTEDESAAIHLYTIQWNKNIDGSEASIFCNLNRTLRDPDRRKLEPWFLYLKLLLTALTKLPAVSCPRVWRGVRNQDSTNYVKGNKTVWWGFTSCTKSIDVLKSNLFLGQTGKRTIFSIDTFDGRSIKNHSAFPNEDEVLLLPGTYLEVDGELDQRTDLHIIQIRQIHPNKQLIETPFTADNPFTHTIVAGDIFWNLALKYKCTLQEIKAMNPGIDDTKLYIGQVIRLPIHASQAQSTMYSHEDSHEIFHTVSSGDTFLRIAALHGCKPDDLSSWNPDIQVDLIYPGQKLRILQNDSTKQL